VHAHSIIWLQVRNIVYVHSNLRLSDKLHAVSYKEGNITWCCTPEDEIIDSDTDSD